MKGVVIIMRSYFCEYPDLIHIEPNKHNLHDFIVKNHVHDKYEISICSSGNIFIDIGGTLTLMSAPCVLLHRPFSVHLVDTDRVAPYIRSNLYFDAEFLSGVDRRVADPERVFTSGFRGIPLTRVQLERLNRISEMMFGESSRHLRLPMLIAILRELETIAPSDSISSDEKRYICDVIGYIKEHFTEPLKSSDIAEKFFVSRTKLDRDFRFYTQTTIKSFLMNIRFKNALRLMRGGMSVQDAAASSGTSDVSNFIRTFKARYGITPHKYISLVDVYGNYYPSPSSPAEAQRPNDKQENFFTEKT